MIKTAEWIAREIILDIAAGGLRPGDSLPPEAAMLRQYGVGRASLREALRLLEVQGLVHIRAGARGGPVVGSASAEFLSRMLALYFSLAGGTYEDLARLYLILEPKIAEMAASSRLDASDVSALEDAVSGSRASPDVSIGRADAGHDIDSVLAALGHNPVWTLLAQAVGLMFADHIAGPVQRGAVGASESTYPAAVVEAILTKEPEKAGRLALAHAERVVRRARAQNRALFEQRIEWR